ncbi:MAG: P1 family peptidase [Spirochaetaceae bacterium]|jgi:L-aminopeptidase/D-esterase-like protein|nr:P1 family peptidase [Spirochaetaceae bacterium]
MEKINIGDIPGFRIGQAQDLTAATGCTVILREEGGVCGADVRGGSPGTRDTDALSPLANRKLVHGILLAGGSSFGLDAAGGVMAFLEAENIGREVGLTRVPNVCAAILFDLACGDHRVRPGPEMGYAACGNAFRGEPFQSGSFGAGTGATVGKFRGPAYAMKGGIGSAAWRQGGLLVGAVAAVNCVGDVLEKGRIIAGVRGDDGRTLVGTEGLILEAYEAPRDFFSGAPLEGTNTVLGCIITNARLDKSGAALLARQGQNGIARAIRPAHSIYDGDTVFAFCSGEAAASLDAAGILAAWAMEGAVIDAVKSARSLGGYPAVGDYVP